MKSDTDKVNTLNLIAKNYWLSGFPGCCDKCISVAKDAIALGQKINFKRGVADAYNNIGIAYIQETNYAEALKNYLVALKLREEMGDKESIGHSYNNIGNAYSQQSNYSEALKNYFTALKIGEQINSKGTISGSYEGIGNVYEAEDNNEEALKNYLVSLKYRKEEADGHGMALSYINIGDIYAKQGNYKEALANYFAILKLDGDYRTKFWTYSSIGNVYMQQGKYADALKNYQVALGMQEQMKDIFSMVDSYINIGRIYLAMHQENTAKQYLQKALSMATESGSKGEVRDASITLSKIDSATGNYKEAYSYHTLYSNIKDSILNEKSAKQVSQLKVQFDTEKKDAQLKTQDLQLQNQKLQNNVLLISVGISLAILGIIILSFYLFALRNRKKKKEYEHMLTDLELTVLKAQLNPHFISNSLSAIKNFIDLQPEKASQFLLKFARLMRMVLEQNEQPYISLKEELDTIEIYMQIESLRLRFGFDYKFNYDSSVDPDELMVPPLILQPTIENVIWHGLASKNEKGYIVIDISREENLLKFTIRDNGIGQESRTQSSGIQVPKKKSFGIAITRKRIEILSKESKSSGYYNLNFGDGITITEMAIPIRY